LTNTSVFDFTAGDISLAGTAHAVQFSAITDLYAEFLIVNFALIFALTFLALRGLNHIQLGFPRDFFGLDLGLELLADDFAMFGVMLRSVAMANRDSDNFLHVWMKRNEDGGGGRDAGDAGSDPIGEGRFCEKSRCGFRNSKRFEDCKELAVGLGFSILK